MSNRKKTIIVSVIIAFLVLVASFFGYRAYCYHDFKRAHEQGTTYEQLDVLMNSKRYVKAVRKAGYDVDSSDVFMYNRILYLTTNDIPAVTIRSTEDDNLFIVTFEVTENNQKENVYFQLDKDFKVTYQSVEDENGNDINITSSQQEKLLKVVKKELKTMLKTIYESMYD